MPENTTKENTGPQAEAGETEQEATVKVSMEKPEMGVLPGGLFMASVPINSKNTNRVIALGWMMLALFKVNGIYQDFEDLKKKHQERLKHGDLSLSKRIKDGIASVLKSD